MGGTSSMQCTVLVRNVLEVPCATLVASSCTEQSRAPLAAHASAASVYETAWWHFHWEPPSGSILDAAQTPSTLVLFLHNDGNFCKSKSQPAAGGGGGGTTTSPSQKLMETVASSMPIAETDMRTYESPLPYSYTPPRDNDLRRRAMTSSLELCIAVSINQSGECVRTLTGCAVPLPALFIGVLKLRNPPP